MARPIAPTPDIETEEELESFLEYISRPRTKKEKEIFTEAKEVYKNTKMRN